MNTQDSKTLSKNFINQVSLSDARKTLVERIPTLKAQKVILAHALGRAAAEQITATCAVPPVRTSAMDGYALPNDGSRADGYLLLEPDHPDPPRIDGRTRRVLTGQPVPKWAWCVAAEEHCLVRGQIVFPRGTWPAGINIRDAGEDTRPGDLIVDCGECLDAAKLARIASIGRYRILVGRRPRVLLISTGNELVRPPGRLMNAWQRYECNTTLIKALLADEGARVDAMPHLPDQKEVLQRTLENLPQYDLLITIGGASNSEADLSRPTLKELGAKFLFERVSIKPGRPTAFGIWHDKPVLCLPGNPVAAFVTCILFAIPAVRKLAGFKSEALCLDTTSSDALSAAPQNWNLSNSLWQVSFEGEVLPDRSRVQILAVKLTPSPNGVPIATPFPVSGSGILRSLTTTDALVAIPPETHVQPGTRLPILWLHRRRFCMPSL